MNVYDFFPQLPQSIPEVNLNNEAIEYLQRQGILGTNSKEWLQKNPLVQPDECERFIKGVHTKYESRFSYGGYGEDRSVLWHDTYLDELRAYYHLGIDINVPAGTELLSPISGEVIVSDHDRDHPSAPQNHGWGNRLMIDPEQGKYILILAHLSDSTRRKAGSLIEKGEMLGYIGKSNENGGWFEHFHVQAIARENIQELLEQGKLMNLDGYAVSMDENIRNIYPNPFLTF